MVCHTIPKGNSLKVNTIAQLEFEPIYYDDTVQHVRQYTTGTVI